MPGSIEVGGRGLEDFQRCDVRRREILQRNGASFGSENLAAVVRGLVIISVEAAHVDIVRFTAAAVHLHARNARCSVRDSNVGQLADVFSDDRIDLLNAVLLDVASRLQRPPKAGDDDSLVWSAGAAASSDCAGAVCAVAFGSGGTGWSCCAAAGLEIDSATSAVVDQSKRCNAASMSPLSQHQTTVIV